MTAGAMVVDGSVTNNPVFNRGFAPMLDRSASQNEVFMALAKCVPAVSSPVGGKAVFDDDDKNINMNDSSGGVPRPNGWGRTSGDNDDAPPWKHSDMKDMAYFYVHKLYEQLITKGNLK